MQWLNVHPHAPNYLNAERSLFECDFLLVKSNFGWLPDVAYMRQDARVSHRPPVGLMISGSVPPRAGDLRRFDVLFYETWWYQRFVAKHPRVFHAFGIDTDSMFAVDGSERDIDWLMVGRPADFKHPEELIQREGRRMLVGEVHGADAAVDRLRQAGVEVRDFVPYSELAELYRRTRTLLVAADLQGGGERAILEARSCGAEIIITRHNPKLNEVAHGPVYDQDYYARQLMSGIDAAIEQVGERTKSARVQSMRRLASNRMRSLPRSIAWWSHRIASWSRHLRDSHRMR